MTLEAAQLIYQGRRMIAASTIRPIADTPAARQRKLELAKEGAKMTLQGTQQLNRIKLITQ